MYCNQSFWWSVIWAAVEWRSNLITLKFNLMKKSVWRFAHGSTYNIDKNERRLKRRNSLGGLEISAPPPNRGKPPSLKTLQPSYQPGEVSNNKYTVKQFSDLKTSSILLRCDWKPNCQVCHLGLFCWCRLFGLCHVHSHKYSWLGRIPSAVANRYRKSASLLKYSASITWIS